ncbi:hypothetical protein NC653_038141 [Populus alba x Populus x berolinensis]|uniref:Uncharacterized protein n=1 Tax=Populus alba x Populus x berolinensis TaxID=444605 RepID=A0AAD6PSW3_9ROSI|nr:hypothetical protein NC653_038141 [Populus alba x Populus x berolinensis]
MHLVSLCASDKAVRFLFPIFYRVLYRMSFLDEIKRFRNMISSADLNKATHMCSLLHEQ